MDAAVEIRDAGPKGLGVFALRTFERGAVILRFERGRVVHVDQLATLTPWESEHLGELTADTCQVLSAPRCYLNHACAPNAISSSDAVRAWRGIQAGEEVTIDYRLNALDDWELRCACPAYNAPHVVIGHFFTLSADLQRQYVPYAPPFVQQEYVRRYGTPGHGRVSMAWKQEWPMRW
jgi:hypothetical protein